jgi:hypothetical protein
MERGFAHWAVSQIQPLNIGSACAKMGQVIMNCELIWGMIINEKEKYFIFRRTFIDFLFDIGCLWWF